MKKLRASRRPMTQPGTPDESINKDYNEHRLLARDVERERTRSVLSPGIRDRRRFTKRTVRWQLPSWTVCRKAGSSCIFVDRPTCRRYPRGQIECLELRIQALEQENEALKRELYRLKAIRRRCFLLFGIT